LRDEINKSGERAPFFYDRQSDRHQSRTYPTPLGPDV